MGLDATVRCRCWEDGTAAQAPCEVRLDDEGYLEPLEGRFTEAFSRWETSACPHEDMQLASERISNWGGYRLFQQALGDAGWEHFPTLRRTLPEANDGLLRSADAAACLEELDRFRDLYAGQETVLIDLDTRDELRSSVEVYGGLFILGGRSGVDVGFDAEGIFFCDRETEEELFRAKRIRQNRRPAPVGEVLYRFRDLDSERTFDSAQGISTDGPDPKAPATRHPERLAVEQRPRTADDFAYAMRGLRAVFEASVQTGNPVRWC